MSLLLLLLGSGAAGPTTVTPTGLGATASLGTPVVTVSSTATPTGLEGTASVGTPTPTTAVNATVTPTGVAGTATVGTAGVSVTVPVTGLAATASRGTVALSASTVPTGLAAASELGTAGVGVRYAPSGLGGTAGLGTPVLGSVVAPSGLSATASRGTHILSASAVLGGLGATGSVGTIATVPGALQVSGRSATSALGTVKVTSVVLGAAAPTTERWLSPRLPTDERMVGILQSSLDRLERTQGRAPVVMTDRRVTSAATLVDADGVVLVDCTAGGVTITLPPATAAIRGRSWAIKKVDSTSNNVTLDGAGSDTIDGSGTYAWNTQNTVVWIQCALVTPPGTYGWVIV